ncbi:hypothetical protein [Ostreiculturibacter nitratireducens]|uniref:hypothetical protein n=1 Tax=Ostreiculturibacter nitratireducens TaxID=3075226 RepID=UPI0031B60771
MEAMEKTFTLISSIVEETRTGQLAVLSASLRFSQVAAISIPNVPAILLQLVARALDKLRLKSGASSSARRNLHIESEMQLLAADE